MTRQAGGRDERGVRERKREAEEKEGEEEAAAKCFLKAIKVCTVQTAASQPAGHQATLSLDGDGVWDSRRNS